jgi:hypothetical protein
MQYTEVTAGFFSNIVAILLDIKKINLIDSRKVKMNQGNEVGMSHFQLLL